MKSIDIVVFAVYASCHFGYVYGQQPVLIAADSDVSNSATTCPESSPGGGVCNFEGSCGYDYIWMPTYDDNNGEVDADGIPITNCVEPYTCTPVLNCYCDGQIWEPCYSMSVLPCSNNGDDDGIEYTSCTPGEDVPTTTSSSSSSLCPTESPLSTNSMASCPEVGLECVFGSIWMPTYTPIESTDGAYSCSGPYACEASEVCTCLEDGWGCIGSPPVLPCTFEENEEGAVAFSSCDSTTDTTLETTPTSVCPLESPLSTNPMDWSCSEVGMQCDYDYIWMPTITDGDVCTGPYTCVNNESCTCSEEEEWACSVGSVLPCATTEEDENGIAPYQPCTSNDATTTTDTTAVGSSSSCPLESPITGSNRVSCSQEGSECDYNYIWMPTIMEDFTDDGGLSFLCTGPYTCDATEFCSCAEGVWLCATFDLINCDMNNEDVLMDDSKTMEGMGVSAYAPCNIPGATSEEMNLDMSTTVATISGGGAATTTTYLPLRTDGSCYDTLDEIFNISANDDLLSTEKKFILCPDTVYEIGTFDVDTTSISNGQMPLTPRSNTIIQCGDDGKSTNNCILKGGHYGIITVPFFNTEDNRTDNVRIVGVTFEQQSLFTIFLGLPGTDFKFEDCILRNTRNNGPVVLSSYPADEERTRRNMMIDMTTNIEDDANDETSTSRKDDDGSTANKNHRRQKQQKVGRQLQEGEVDEEDLLHVTFSQCSFYNNSQNTGTARLEYGLMTIRNHYHDIKLVENVFMNNNYGCDQIGPIGYFLRNVGSRITLESNCFINNRFFGSGLVMMFPDSTLVSSSNNYGPSDDDLTCDYISNFETDDDFENNEPQCISFENETCSLVSQALTIDDPIPSDQNDCEVYGLVSMSSEMEDYNIEDADGDDSDNDEIVADIVNSSSSNLLCVSIVSPILMVVTIASAMVSSSLFFL